MAALRKLLKLAALEQAQLGAPPDDTDWLPRMPCLALALVPPAGPKRLLGLKGLVGALAGALYCAGWLR